MSLLRKEDDDVTINWLETIRLMVRKAPIIIICTLICGLISYSGTYFLSTPQYDASTTFYVNNVSSGENSTTITQSDLNASVQLVDTYSAIIKSNTVLNKVLEEVDAEIEIEELKEKISAQSVDKTEVFQVIVRDSDPKMAAKIANAIADVAPQQIAEIVEGSSVKVVDYAEIPIEHTTPRYKICLLIGLLIGFILSVGIIFIRATLDNSLKSEADFKQWEYPVLGVIPDLDGAKKSKYNHSYGYGARE